MLLDEECKSCLYDSQMKKVESTQTDAEKLGKFKSGVKALCGNPPENYCAPLLMRDIDGLHRKIFGCGIDYSREKTMFNSALSAMEGDLYKKICSSTDPLCEALKYAMASNYIDFARLSNLDGKSVDVVIAAAERAAVDEATLESFKKKLETARTLCCLHDNCGEIVLDKLLLRTIKSIYPRIFITSVVRGKPIINDATMSDAEEVCLGSVAKVVGNGSGVPGTYLKEVSPEILKLLRESDIILSKGLGNLETLYGEGFEIFYAFNCKCAHISKRFNLPLWSPAFIEENEI